MTRHTDLYNGWEFQNQVDIHRRFLVTTGAVSYLILIVISGFLLQGAYDTVNNPVLSDLFSLGFIICLFGSPLIVHGLVYRKFFGLNHSISPGNSSSSILRPTSSTP